MRFFLLCAILLIVGLAGVYGAGSSLPEQMTTIRGAQFKADAEVIWPLITDYEKLPSWNKNIASTSPVGEDGEAIKSDAPLELVEELPVGETAAEAASDQANVPESAADEAVTEESDRFLTDENTLWRVEDEAGGYMILSGEVLEPQRRYEAEIVETNYPFTGTWEFELTPNNQGTFIKLIEQGQVSNPFIRFANYYVIGSDYGINQFFEAMELHLMEEVTIEEMPL